MPSFWRVVNEVIEKSDILLEVLDARLPELTRHIEVEKKVAKTNKKLILVVNKSDLIGQRQSEKIKKQLQKEYPVVFVSSIEHQGTKILREKILAVGKQMKKENVTVGVVGYPNVGKSSVINVVRGRKSASTSSHSGHTKGLQKIRITKRIMMLDSPGVLPFSEKDEEKHILIGTKMFSQTKDPDIYACKIIEHCNHIDGNIIPYFYDIEPGKDAYETIEALAIKRNMKKRGDEFDIDRAARLVIKDWQTGKIKLL
jgi:ribosome biogenesis GTPase A